MRYRTSVAFRTALEVHLLERTRRTGVPIQRLRKAVLFERLLARLLVVAPNRWVLKGALALDFRLGAITRATKDMDLGRQDDAASATADLLAVQNCDLDDHFTFRIVPTDRLHALRDATAVRYHVHAQLAGRTFENAIVDIGFSDLRASTPEPVTGPDLLSFSGIAPIQIPVLPLEQHIAEKLHAYTRGYGGGAIVSTRVKDLVDLVIIARHVPFDAARLRAALVDVFAGRGVQPLPPQFPLPPSDWEAGYRKLAGSVGIEPDVVAAHARVAAFLNPILAADPAAGIWDHTQQRWLATRDRE